MTALVWDEVQNRRYEAGVSHGVFYPIGDSGKVWNGLVSVNEGFVGAEQFSYHLDGVKYMDFVGSKNYQANVSAYQIPKDFLSCVGQKPLITGVRLTKQVKRRFHFSYRTEFGDGYKIHLVYNVLASQVGQSYSTESSSPNPTLFTWVFDANPVAVDGFKSSAHYIVDSNRTDPGILSELEDILYGTESTDPEFPTIEALVAMFV